MSDEAEQASRDLETVYQSLLYALGTVKLTAKGEALTVQGHVTDTRKVSANELPYLALATGTIDTAEWGSEDWTDLVTWTIPAQLVVQGPVDDGGSAMRMLLVDLMQHCRRVRGLPHDREGQLVVDDFSLRYGDRIRKGEIVMWADRKGPHLSSIRVDGPFDSGRYVANLTFRLGFLMNMDPRKLHRAQVAVLGMRPFDVAHSETDTSLPIEVQRRPYFSDSDRTATGRFEMPGPGPRVVEEGVQLQIGPGTYELRNRVLSLRPSPASASIAAAATQQLYAILTMQDDSTQHVGPSASWGTSSALIATVSSTGLVTGVGAGTATITATYAGLSGTASITVT